MRCGAVVCSGDPTAPAAVIHSIATESADETCIHLQVRTGTEGEERGLMRGRTLNDGG
jgi:hypothetical protein